MSDYVAPSRVDPDIRLIDTGGIRYENQLISLLEPMNDLSALSEDGAINWSEKLRRSR
jgi:hypothetical protein